jgi:hypothetical protein
LINICFTYLLICWFSMKYLLCVSKTTLKRQMKKKIPLLCTLCKKTKEISRDCFLLNEWSYFFAGLLIFLLGHLGLSTGFCWGYLFWQLNCSELLWITLSYCELVYLLWISLIYIEPLHYLAAVEGNINPRYLKKYVCARSKSVFSKLTWFIVILIIISIKKLKCRTQNK